MLFEGGERRRRGERERERERGKEEEKKEEVVVKEIVVPSTVKAVSEKTFDDIAEALTSAF